MAVRLRPPRRRRRRPRLFRRRKTVRVLQDHERRVAARGRALHRRRRHRRLLVVPLPHRRRPDQPLRPHLAAFLRLRLQALRPGRPRLELADRLRGRRPLLRQGGDVHRRRGQPRRHPERARRRLSRPAAPQGARAADRARGAQDGHPLHPQPPRRHHAVAQRPPRVPLLRAVRPRLPGRLQLLRQPDADLPGAGDGPARRHRPGDGQEHHDGRRRRRRRRHLHRQANRAGASSPVPRARRGRQRLRVGAVAAELEDCAAPGGRRQLRGSRRPLPHGYGGVRHRRHRAGPRRHAAVQQRRRRRRPLVHALVGLGEAGGARLSARLPHRARRRIRHARYRDLRRVGATRRLRHRHQGAGATRLRHSSLLRRPGGR